MLAAICWLVQRNLFWRKGLLHVFADEPLLTEQLLSLALWPGLNACNPSQSRDFGPGCNLQPQHTSEIFEQI